MTYGKQTAVKHALGIYLLSAVCFELFFGFELEMRKIMDYEKNQILTVEIVDMTAQGEGIGKLDGFPFSSRMHLLGIKPRSV